MAPTIPTTEPTRCTAGDTWQWTKTLADFPASDGWALSYVVTGPSTLRVDASADGDGFAVTVAATATAELPAGDYRWAAYATLDGARHQAGSGLIRVEPNLASVNDGESTESWATRSLRIVEAALEQRLPAGMEEYQIAGKAVKHLSFADLYAMRAKLRHEVAAERNGGTLARLEVTFT